MSRIFSVLKYITHDVRTRKKNSFAGEEGLVDKSKRKAKGLKKNV